MDNIVSIAFDFDGVFAPTEDLNRQKADIICGELMGWDETPPGLLTTQSYIEGINEHGLEGFYVKVIGLTRTQFAQLNSIWEERVIESDTPVYGGIRSMLWALQNFRFGFFSLQGTGQIEQILAHNGLMGLVDGSSIIGYDQHRTIKPDPTSLVQCIQALNTTEDGVVYVIGDQEVDIMTADGAKSEFPNIRFITVGVEYGFENGGIDSWGNQPNYRAKHPMDIPKQVVKDFPGRYRLSEAGILETI